jgi:hypothetical protein
MRPVGQRADRVAAGLCAVGAVALFASTFMNWYPGVEGAYFNRSEGAPATAGVFSSAEPWLDAWQSFAFLDVVLALLAAASLALALILMRGTRAVAAAWTAVALAAIAAGGVVAIAARRPPA